MSYINKKYYNTNNLYYIKDIEIYDIRLKVFL